MTRRTVRYAAPGRVNLMGEHTDYNLGWALPIALPRRTTVTFTPEETEAITVRSDRFEGSIRIPLDTTPGGVSGWAGYVAGAVWALRLDGHPVPGGTMSVTSDIELGSGLASSASLECAVLGAIAAAAAISIDRISLARIAMRAENHYVGAPTGLLDQLAVLFGQPSAALLIDFRELTIEPVAFDPEAYGVALLLIDSQSRHCHVGGEYAARRASCEQAAADLGVCALRDIQDLGSSVLGAVTDPVSARRARHILTDNCRVMEAVAALNNSDYSEFGRILTESHQSMRDDFEITTDHVDLIVDSVVQAGAFGARMTGGGFGGVVLALTPVNRIDLVGAAVREALRDSGYQQPVLTRTYAAAGAG